MLTASLSSNFPHVLELFASVTTELTAVKCEWRSMFVITAGVSLRRLTGFSVSAKYVNNLQYKVVFRVLTNNTFLRNERE